MDVIEYGLFIGLINAGVCCCRGIFIRFNFIFPVGGCLVKMIQGETEAHSIMVRKLPSRNARGGTDKDSSANLDRPPLLTMSRLGLSFGH